MLAGPYTLLDQSAGTRCCLSARRGGYPCFSAGRSPPEFSRPGRLRRRDTCMPRHRSRCWIVFDALQDLRSARRSSSRCCAAIPAAAPAVASVVTGAVSPEEVRRNIALMDVDIPQVCGTTWRAQAWCSRPEGQSECPKKNMDPRRRSAVGPGILCETAVSRFRCSQTCSRAPKSLQRPGTGRAPAGGWRRSSVRTRPSSPLHRPPDCRRPCRSAGRGSS